MSENIHFEILSCGHQNNLLLTKKSAFCPKCQIDRAIVFSQPVVEFKPAVVVNEFTDVEKKN